MLNILSNQDMDWDLLQSLMTLGEHISQMSVEPIMSGGPGIDTGAIAPSGISAGAARSRASGDLSALLIPALSLLVFFVGWEAIVSLTGISSYVFPAPSQVLRALWYDLRSPEYWVSVAITLSEILVGFVAGSILGIGLGTALAPIARSCPST